ncbi:MAG: TldD/PmbA family protein [Candidatus Heimdallarchaeota archaeon]|nr:TldD/PmbA family protein [Candidatus Heimdallarchaeota archaeon]
MTDLIGLANLGVTKGEELGATQIEVLVSSGRKKSIAIDGNSITGSQEQSNNLTQARVYIGNQLGLATSTSIREDAIISVVEKAISLAKYAPPNEHFKSLAEPSIREHQKVEGMYDYRIEELETQLVMDKVEMLINGATEVHEKANVSGKLDVDTRKTGIVNSLGISANQEYTLLFSNAWTSINLSSDNAGSSYDWAMTRNLDDDIDYHALGKKGAEAAKSQLHAKMAPSSTVPVIMDHVTTSSTLKSMIESGVSGFNVMAGTSYFSDKIGDQLSNTQLKVWDDPHIQQGINSKIYDDEGVPTTKLTLFEEGILKSYITDSYSANYLGLESSGHARNFNGTFYPTLHQMQIEGGTDNYQQMIEDMRRGVVIKNRGLIVWGESPEISVKIDQGFWVENGEIQFPLKNSMLGTNIYDFLKNISAISKDTVTEFNNKSPAIRIEDISIAGESSS